MPIESGQQFPHFRRNVLLLLVALSCISHARADARADAPGSDEALEDVLRKLAARADDYAAISTQMVCDESVKYVAFNIHGKPAEKNRARFTYSIRFSSKPSTPPLSDFRTARRKTREIGVSEKKEIGYDTIETPIAWVFIFAAARQDHFDYSISSSTDDTEGSRRVWVSFEPTESYKRRERNSPGRFWYGRALVDVGNGNIHKVEAMLPEDHLAKQRMAELVEHARKDPAALPEYPEDRTFEFSAFSTEFGLERFGLTFPSLNQLNKDKHLVKISGRDIVEKVIPVDDIRQNYKNCQFTVVSTHVSSPRAPE